MVPTVFVAPNSNATSPTDSAEPRSSSISLAQAPCARATKIDSAPAAPARERVDDFCVLPDTLFIGLPFLLLNSRDSSQKSSAALEQALCPLRGFVTRVGSIHDQLRTLAWSGALE